MGEPNLLTISPASASACGEGTAAFVRRAYGEALVALVVFLADDCSARRLLALMALVLWWDGAGWSGNGKQRGGRTVEIEIPPNASFVYSHFFYSVSHSAYCAMPEQVAQSKYPLIDSDPHAFRVVRYMRPSDYGVMAATTASVPAALMAWRMTVLSPHMSYAEGVSTL